MIEKNDAAAARKFLDQVSGEEKGAWEWQHANQRCDQSLYTINTRGHVLAIAFPDGDGNRVLMAIGDGRRGLQLEEWKFGVCV